MNVIDFSKKSMSEMNLYFQELEGESRLLALSHLRAEELCEVRKSLDAGERHPGLPLIQQIGVRVEIWESFGLSMEDYMSQIFAGIKLDDLHHQGDKFRNWEELVQNPRASRMSGAGLDKKLVAENKAIKAANGVLPENFAELDYDNQRKILDGRQVHKVTSRMVDCGSPILSIRPIRAEKDPCYDENTGEKLHTPGLNSVECVSLKSYVHLAPICRVVPVVRGGGEVLRIPSANKDGFVDMKSEDGDITGGSSSLKVVIVGFTEVIKSRQCGEVGKIVVGGEVRDLIEESRSVADEILSAEMLGDPPEVIEQIFKTWMWNCSLGEWYRERRMDGWKSVLKAYSGGTLKMGRMPRIKSSTIARVNEHDPASIDAALAESADHVRRNGKVVDRSLKFTDFQVKRKVLEIAGLLDAPEYVAYKNRWVQMGWANKEIERVKEGIADRNRKPDEESDEMRLPEIPMLLMLEHEAEARKMLTVSYTARLMRDHKAIQNPTHGRMGGRQMKRRNGDKSCTVNGARTGECVAWFATMRLSVEGEVFWEGVVDRYDLLKEVERLGADSGGVLGFDWENYARDMLAEGEFKPSHSSQVLSTKQNREMLAEVMIRRMTQYSLEDSLCGKSPWVLLDSEGLYNGEVIDIEFKAAHCESEVVAEIVDAMRRVELAGEPVNRRTVSSAMKRKGAWELLIAENQKANGTLPDISSGNVMKAAFKAA